MTNKMPERISRPDYLEPMGSYLLRLAAWGEEMQKRINHYEKSCLLSTQEIIKRIRVIMCLDLACAKQTTELFVGPGEPDPMTFEPYEEDTMSSLVILRDLGAELIALWDAVDSSGLDSQDSGVSDALEALLEKSNGIFK